MTPPLSPSEREKRLAEIEAEFTSCPHCNGQGGLQEGTPDRWHIESCQLCHMTGKLYNGAQVEELLSLARQPLPFRTETRAGMQPQSSGDGANNRNGGCAEINSTSVHQLL